MNQLEHSKSYFADFVIAFSQNRKISIKYSLVFLAFVICLGMICLIDVGTGAGWWLKATQLLSFFTAGICFFYLLQHHSRFEYLRFLSTGILYTLPVSAVICFALLCFYLFTNNRMVVMAIASSAAFSLPYIIKEAWLIFTSIPDRQYPIWTKPLDKREIEEVFLPVSLNVRFRMTAQYFDTRETQFEKRAMEHVKLGKMFLLMVDEENEFATRQIHITDENKKRYGWEFYLERVNGLYQQRIDPEMSFSENGVGDNGLITVKRVKLHFD